MKSLRSRLAGRALPAPLAASLVVGLGLGVMVVAEADPNAIDELRRRLYKESPSIVSLVNEIAPQLMGLSTQGSVHIKTIYSAVNMLRRTAPGPVFAAMVANPRFQAVGDGEFAMARS